MSSGKTEIPGIYKVRNGILINTDNQALASYKNKKKREQRIDEMQNDIQYLKNDLKEIKELLRGLVK